jgi:hypothetical protein
MEAGHVSFTQPQPLLMTRFPPLRGVLPLAAALLFIGCAADPRAASVQTSRPGKNGTGYLIVNSAVEPHDDDGVIYAPHTGYELLSRDGRHVMYVRNHIGDHDDQPATVPLPAGIYAVSGLGRYSQHVLAPVQVDAGKTTEVDLAHRDWPIALQVPSPAH